MSVRQRLGRIVKRARRKEIRTVPVPYATDEATLLAGRRALVTGASSGIGRAIATKFAAAGASVIVAGRDAARLAAVAPTIGPDVTPLVLDVTRPETFDDIFDGLPELPDILVNSAGVVSFAPFGEISLDEYSAVMDTNLKSVLFLSQSLSKRWISTGVPGNILNISSGSQFKPGWTTYQVSKNALDSLTKGMASFLVEHDIIVNAIAPGPVSTPMLGIDGGDITFPLNPSERAATPEEVAQWSTWLVSDFGRYAVGTTFALTGGNGIFQWERQDNYYSGLPVRQHRHDAPRAHPTTDIP